MDVYQALLSALIPQAEAAPAPAADAAGIGRGPGGFNAGGMLTGSQPQPQPVPGVAIGAPPQPQQMTEEIRRMFAPPPPTPPMRPAVPQSRPAALPTPAQQAPADDGATTASDVQRFIRSLAVGAAGVNPTSPKWSAFAQGAAGSMMNSYNEKERDKNRQLQERRLDTADRRADRALAGQERREDRAEADLQRKIKRDEQVDAERQVRTRERLARIAKVEDQRLDSKDIGRINDQVNRHARYLQIEVNNARMTPEQAERVLEDYKRDTIEKYVKRDPGAKAPPKGAGGTGTDKDPYTRHGATPQEALEYFKSLKPGEHFLDPNSNKIIRRN